MTPISNVCIELNEIDKYFELEAVGDTASNMKLFVIFNLVMYEIVLLCLILAV